MDSKVLFNVQYGLFVLSARENDKDNACIINTVTQVTAAPVSKDRISIAVNKSNFTHDIIAKTKKFTVSIISEAATFDLFKHFGFQSGRNVDKFADFDKIQRTANGTLAITEGTNSFISANVIQQVELDTHSIFIAEVVDMQKFSDVPSTTYNFYQKNIKPKPAVKVSGGKTKWVCRICGYVHEGDEPPAICPLCKHPSTDFEKVVEAPEAPAQKNKYAGTKTEKNLRDAFAGESQARNMYTYFAFLIELLPRFSSKLPTTRRNTLNFGLKRWANLEIWKKTFCTRRKANITSGRTCIREWHARRTKKAFMSLRNSSEALRLSKNITRNAIASF